MALFNLATEHFRLGNSAEAERYTRLAAAIYRDLGDKANTARILLLEGRLHEEAGKPGPAEEAFREALRLAEAGGAKDQRAQALLALGMLMERRGKPDEAARSYATAADLFRETGDAFRADLVRLKAAFLRLADDKVLVNLEEVATLEEHTRRLGDDRLTGHFYSARAIYHLEGKRWQQAEQDLRRAVAAEERFRGGDQDPLLKAAAGEYLATPYAHLALALHEQGNAAGAFAASEAQKGRALTELLERGGPASRKGLTEREAADERRLREAVAAAAAQYRSGRGFAAKDAAALQRFREELAEAQARYDELRRGLNLARPDYRVRHAAFRPPDLERVQRTLFAREPDLAILSYVVGKSFTLVVVLTAGERADDPARVTVHRVAVTKEALTAAARTLAEGCRKPAGDPDAGPLEEWLVAPAAKELRGQKRLVIVPCAPLLSLPFQALRKGDGPYLLERYAVGYTASVAALLELTERPRPAAPDALPLLAVGRPAFTTGLRDLPASEAEARALDELYGKGARVLLGKEAARAALKADAGRARVLHLATHGLVNEARPLFSALAVAPEGDGDDGRLYAHDVLDLDLRADLVVLSACESGLGREYASEGVLGLAWAFLAAGAPSAVVSQWSVADESTSRLMQKFHERLWAAPAPGKAEALRQAQLALLKDRASRHPFFWAPFALVGDGR
jgi:CHAT domain-containing protein